MLFRHDTPWSLLRNKLAPLLATVVVSSTSSAADVTWEGLANDDWAVGFNWDSGVTPATGDVIYIDSGAVVYNSGTSPDFRSVHLLDGTMTVSGGYLEASYIASRDSRINGTFLHTGGTVELNEVDVGSGTGDNGFYQLDGGELIIPRNLNGFSLYLGGNHDSDAGGTGTFQVRSGSVITRGGVKLGHASVSGTGTFEVVGSQASEIGIGTSGSGDGSWEQNSGSTLKVSIDRGGLTPIFLDDIEGTNSTYATFESGALLDVDHYNAGGPGTWTVMEVENGDITDNGLALAPSVDASVWSFSVDNTGVNGLLTVTSIAPVPTSGYITWDGSESTDWNDGLNWDNSAGPVTDGDRIIINSGTVDYTAPSGENLRVLRLLGGTMTISAGAFKATRNANWDSFVNGTLYQTGGTAEINELEVGGRSIGANGSVYVSGGSFTVSRSLNGYSLYLGSDHDTNDGGTGTFEVSGGSFKTRNGVKLGDATKAGIGTFAVLGSAVTEVGIGSHGTTDGLWTQHSGSTLKVGIDYNGVTTIFIDDIEGVDGTSATFESGSLLDVGYYNTGGNGGTWTVMEVENGDITDNGLGFAPGVDAGIWSFNVDNSGANGVLTVTSTASPADEDVTWNGSVSSDWENGLNWENNTGPYTQGDRATINSGTVVYNEDSSANLKAFYLNGGTMTISDGLFKSTAQSNWDSRVGSTLYHIGGTAEINELEIGSFSGTDGVYYLAGGELVVARGLSGHSLYLGGNHDSNAGGSGTLEITSGSMVTRTGVKLGHETQVGTGTFAVFGSESSEIGIGTQGSGDGWWTQHAGSTLKVGIAYTGVTKIFIDDVEGTNSTYATFESGSLLDVDYYMTGTGGGTWIVMEVENGDIIDNGLAFAPGVDTDVWSFSVDNSGANGRLRVTATGEPTGLELTVGNTLQQQMRYGIDYERLWFWYGSSSEKTRVAEWSVVDCDVDFVRVAMNSGYELTENTYDLSAYTSKIIPMMQSMQAANPDVKFFASPRPLNDEVSGATWQPYPLWVTGASSYGGGDYDFDDIKCAEYIVKYLLLMKSYGFQISYIDVTNEWQADSGGRATQADFRDVFEYLNVTYLASPWEHPEYPGITLTADDIPQIVGPSSWNFDQGSWWIDGLNTQEKKDAIQIASSHNTDKSGTAQEFVDTVREYCNPGTEIWNTELHGWKGHSGNSSDEVLTYAFMLEAINAGFHGISGWLAIGTTSQGHSYILNTGNPTRNVKYYMFEKLTNTSNRGYALEVNEPDELEADSQDANASVSALIRGNLLTVWVLNQSDTDHPAVVNIPAGRTISEFPIQSTCWSEVDALALAGETESISALSDTSFYAIVKGSSAYCFEILLEPEGDNYIRIEAENYDSSSAAPFATETSSDDGAGLNLSDIDDGDWTCYENLDLSNADTIRLRIARPANRPDGAIEIRTGSETGTVIGRVAIPETGGWQSWQTIETPLDATAGNHDLYLKYVVAGSDQSGSDEAMFNLNWLELVLPPTETPTGVTGAPESGTEITLNWESVPNAIGYTVRRSTVSGGPYPVIDDTVTGTTYTDDDVTAGTTYYYVIETRYGSYSSSLSNEIVTVPSEPVRSDEVTVNEMTLSESGDSFSLSIQNSVLGHNYQAQETDTLFPPDWQNIGDVFPGTGGEVPFVIPTPSTNPEHFYRIRIWRQ
ncbi:MAG: carbohydrate-binding protein [Opitutaceae bacterium]